MRLLQGLYRDRYAGQAFTLDTVPADFAIAVVDGDELTYGDDFTVATAPGEDDTTVITITIKKEAFVGLEQNTDITIEYDAIMNENALDEGLATNDADGNEVIVYTYEFDVSKVDGATGDALEGVKFTLTRTNEDGGLEYYFMPSDEAITKKLLCAL